jgi:hypothetical protein
MKNDKLEQFFADKLENFEAPYTEGAWESMASQLDRVSGGSSLGKSIAKWTAITVGSAAVIGGIYFLSKDSNTEVTSNTELIVENEINSSTNDLTIETENTTSEKTSKTSESVTVFEKTETTTPSSVQSNAIQGNQTVYGSDSPISKPITQPNPTTPNQSLAVTQKQKEFVAGNLSSTFVCPGETVRIENASDDAYVRVLVNGSISNLNPGKSINLRPEATTRVSFLDENNEIFSSRTIEVGQVQQPIIDVVANVYEEGLPVAKFRVFGDYKQVSWDFRNGNHAEGFDVTTHYFEKGQYDVITKVIDANGCAIEAITKIDITEKYNLLATNSIRLNDHNLETRTFMPFCLKERNVSFTLTIIDPKDNAVIYTTKEVNKPWDGSDMRTGRPGIVNKTYIWQVQLDETMPGERGIYSGTITIVE